MELRPVLLPDDFTELERLFESCRIADGHAPLGEHKYLELVGGMDAESIGIVGHHGGEVIAYAHVTPHPGEATSTLEVAVHPLRRTDDVLGEMLDAALAEAREAGGKLARLWMFQPALAGLLRRLGFEEERELRQVRRPLPPDERPRLPAGVEVRPFRRECDEERWLELNNRAFAGHPDNGSWTLEVLVHRQQQPWFDPDGFRMAWEEELLVGFCWTKLHPERLGEIYVIAVAPERQGGGLGRALALDGLWYLHDRVGASTGMLYVDSSNAPALALYEHLGFHLDHVDRSFITRL